MHWKLLPLSYFRPKIPSYLVRRDGNDFQTTGFYQTENAVLTGLRYQPTNIKPLVFDLVDETPEDIFYNLLKRAVLSRLSASQEKRLQQLLSLVDLADHTPSQPPHHIRSLASGINLNDTVLRQLWMKCLSANMAACHAIRNYCFNLEELAEVADRIQELYIQPCAHTMETPIPSPAFPQQSDILTILV
nr:gag pol polyprotein [Hymenolepis microstoma]